MEELTEQAKALNNEALDLEKQAKQRVQPVIVQLGQIFVKRPELIKKVVREWDTKGKGEYLKAEFRLHMRSLGLNCSSADSDAMFDGWDGDGGGTLDAKELTGALHAAMEKANKWQREIDSDPKASRALLLRRRATLADEAAEAAQQADELEDEFHNFEISVAENAEMRLGELLLKRRIKPGSVVINWSKSRGIHSEEVSKKEFRDGVSALGLAGSNVKVQDIDTIFETCASAPRDPPPNF